MKYRYGSHTVFQIEYHFVWVTKYRYKVLTGESPEFGEGDLRSVRDPDHQGSGSQDHVHIMVSSPPTLAPSEIMRRLKGRTSSKLFEEFARIRKRYWGQHFGARGYFCATVGQMTEEMIKSYLEHHFEPRPNDDFRMEGE